MIWVALGALIVVFVVGYSIMTSADRRAVRLMAQLFHIQPLWVENMLQDMGATQAKKFITLINEGYVEDVKQAAILLFIYQVFIKDSAEENIIFWRNKLLVAEISPLLSAEHTEKAISYFQALDIDAFELAQFRRYYNQTFNQLHEC